MIPNSKMKGFTQHHFRSGWLGNGTKKHKSDAHGGLPSTTFPSSTSGKSGAGFTLIELLIVLAALVIIAALSLPFIQSFQTTADLATVAGNIASTLRRAQSQTVAGQDQSSWGVYFDNGAKKFILFQGQDYAGRDQAYDQATDYPANFNLSTDFAGEIYFYLYTNTPSAVGTITLTSANADIKTITINSSGLVQINE